MKQQVRSQWQRTLIVCGKCSRKVDGGFGPKHRTSLGKALRRYLGLAKGRKAAIGFVDTACLGICPKGAVVALDAGHPQNWWIVRAGTDVDAVAGLFSLERPRVVDAQAETATASWEHAT